MSSSYFVFLFTNGHNDLGVMRVAKRRNQPLAKPKRIRAMSRIANIGTNRGEWWLFTLILFTCLISFASRDFENDTIQNKAEAAYARSDLIEKRNQMMEQWAEYLAG